MVNGTINDGVRDSPSVSAARIVLTVKTDPVITAINRDRAARAELDGSRIMLPNGNPAIETEEYAAWETASHKAQDVAATAWSEVKFASPTHAFRLSWARLRRLPTEPRA